MRTHQNGASMLRRRILGILMSLALLLGVPATTLLVTAGPASASGSYDNASIADDALVYVNKNYGKDCWPFVRDMVYKASGGTQDISAQSGDYFQHLSAAGGTQITSLDSLAKGDVVQEGQYGGHTYIIVYRVSGSTFEVVDSNHDPKYHPNVVYEYQRTVPLGNDTEAFRFGTVKTNPVYEAITGDFNGDGIGDIGLRNISDGIFFMRHGPNFSDQISYNWAPGYNYQPFVGDFNGDGLADIGLRNTSNGVFYIKHGPNFSDQISYTWAPGTNYEAITGDFNGDGIGDIGLRNISDGIFFMRHGPNFSDQISYNWGPGAGTDLLPITGDFNGDGIGDIGLRRISTGTFYIKHGPSFGDQVSYPWAPGSNYQPFVGDFNGDGLADIGLRNTSNGVFYIKHGPSFGDQVSYAWAIG